jgi:hypothetical protein
VTLGGYQEMQLCKLGRRGQLWIQAKDGDRKCADDALAAMERISAETLPAGALLSVTIGVIRAMGPLGVGRLPNDL